MDSKVCCCVFQLALLGVALALTGPIIADGSVEVGLASKAAAAATGANAARQMMTTQATTAGAKSVMGLEVRRRVLGNISPSSLDPNRPACIGSCPAAGGAYTRGCSKTYQCAG